MTGYEAVICGHDVTPDWDERSSSLNEFRGIVIVKHQRIMEKLKGGGIYFKKNHTYMKEEQHISGTYNQAKNMYT